MQNRRIRASLALIALLTSLRPGLAQTSPAAPPAAADQGMMMLTVFLKHDQSKTLGEINAQLAKQHYPERFPPKGVEIVSWYVMMGIG